MGSKSQDPACPFGPQSQTAGSATATGSRAKKNPSVRACLLPGARFPSCQTPRGTCPHSARPGRAQNLWPPLVKSSNVNRGMSRLAQSHQAPTGAINLYNMGKEECTSQQASGAGGGVSRKPGVGGLPFFGSTTGCREQKINLSAWLSPAVGLALHKQRNTLWFCSITTTAGPFWGARSLLEATLMQDGST